MSPYEILGVDSTATLDEIRAAYRKLAFKYHPDRNQGNKEAEKKFKAISESYEILANPEKRRFFDAYGTAPGAAAATHGGSSGFGADLEKLFEMFGAVFGQPPPSNPKRKGKAKPSKPCPNCKGEGMIGSDLGFFMFRIVCPKCFGTKRVS